MQGYVGILLAIAALLQIGSPRPPDSGENIGNQIIDEEDSMDEGADNCANSWSEGWSTRVTEGACKYSLEQLREALNNQSEWAFQMMESSALAMSGFIFGSTHQLGNYEECLDIKAPFWGKYCMAKVHLDWKEGAFLKEGTVWNKIWNSTRKKHMIRREWMTWAICIPSVCSSAEARSILSDYLQPMRDSLHVRRKGLSVEDVFCRTMDPEEIELHPEWNKGMTIGQLIMTVFLFGLITMVTWATIYEECFYSREGEMKSSPMAMNTAFNDSKDALWERIVLCFSIRRNWSKLARTRAEGKPPGTFDAVHGYKTSNMVLVTVGHRNFFTLGAPMFNSQYVEQFYSRPETALIMGGTIIVDTFFFISGCLLLHGVLEEKQKLLNPIKAVLLMALRRYLRLVPVLMVIVAFYSTLFPRIGSGPVWESTIGAQRDNCIDNWWTNLLCLQTFVRPETMCVIQSWYVAVEFHAFILCAPVALFYRSQRRLGTWILIAATSLSMIVPFILTIVYHLEALLMPFISVLQNLSLDPTFLRVYIPTYMRAIPYFVGMLCALAIRRENKKKSQLRKAFVVAAHVLSFLILLVSCYSSWIFFRPDAPTTNPIAAASFSVFTRCAWSLSLSWQMFATATSNGWWIGRVMAWRPLAPFGRLTYGAFLTHAAIQLYDVSSMATPKNISVFYMVTSNVSDFFLSYFFAMILFLCIEAPIASLEKIVLGTVISAKGGVSRGDSEDHKTSDFGGCVDQSNLLNVEKSRPVASNTINHLLHSEA